MTAMCQNPAFVYVRDADLKAGDDAARVGTDDPGTTGSRTPRAPTVSAQGRLGRAPPTSCTGWRPALRWLTRPGPGGPGVSLGGPHGRGFRSAGRPGRHWRARNQQTRSKPPNAFCEKPHLSPEQPGTCTGRPNVPSRKSHLEVPRPLRRSARRLPPATCRASARHSPAASAQLSRSSAAAQPALSTGQATPGGARAPRPGRLRTTVKATSATRTAMLKARPRGTGRDHQPVARPNQTSQPQPTATTKTGRRALECSIRRKSPCPAAHKARAPPQKGHQRPVRA